jgi:lipopolysaccharide/colanic/teichoic acid biosynthesis glycosyltransferase
MRIFSVFPAQTWVLFICDLLLSSGIYIGCLFLLVDSPASAYVTTSQGWLRILLAVASILVGIYFNELYVHQRVASRVALVLQLSHVFGLSLVLQTVLAYVFPAVGLPRRVVLLATLAGFPVLFLWRVGYSSFLWKLIGLQSVVLVGNGSLARAIAIGILERPDRGIRLVGYVGNPVSEDLIPGTYLGPSEQLPSIVEECRPDRVVVACSDQLSGDLPIEELLTLRRAGTTIEDGSRVYEFIHSRICSSEFRPEQYIFDQTLVHRPGSLALQSIYINLMALAGIVLLMPLMVILAVLVKISTRGPILDPLACSGYRGIPFLMLRFRVIRTVRGTDRVFLTRLGRFLRRTHLEELPALLNLLRGEMALVGPRPDRVEYARVLDDLIPFYAQRNALKPGLTGWSQINLDPKDYPPDAVTSLEYDLYYLKNISLPLDAYVLLHQLRQILSFAA